MRLDIVRRRLPRGLEIICLAPESFYLDCACVTVKCCKRSTVEARDVTIFACADKSCYTLPLRTSLVSRGLEAHAGLAFQPRSRFLGCSLLGNLRRLMSHMSSYENSSMLTVQLCQQHLSNAICFLWQPCLRLQSWDIAADSVGLAAGRGDSLVGHIFVSRKVDNGDVDAWWACRTQIVERTMAGTW